jgi:regulatory LacI family protein
MSHATVKDIARLAGVSTATVSRVINASSTVSPNTRTAVITAIDQLKYTPNRNASELAVIAAIKRRRGCMRVAPVQASPTKKRQLALSRIRAEDTTAWEVAAIDKQIEGLRKTFKQIESQLNRIKGRASATIWPRERRRTRPGR